MREKNCGLKSGLLDIWEGKGSYPPATPILCLGCGGVPPPFLWSCPSLPPMAPILRIGAHRSVGVEVEAELSVHHQQRRRVHRRGAGPWREEGNGGGAGSHLYQPPFYLCCWRGTGSAKHFTRQLQDGGASECKQPIESQRLPECILHYNRWGKRQVKAGRRATSNGC